MAKSKQQKQEILKQLEEKIAKAKSVIFVGYEKVKIKDQDKLRGIFKKENGEFLVTKKTILNLALKNLKFENLEDLKLNKEVALALSYKDEIMPAKMIVSFSRGNENIKIKGGIFEKKFIDLETIKFLSALPLKQTLQAQFVANLQSPLTGLVNILRANLKGLISIFDGLSKKTI